MDYQWVIYRANLDPIVGREQAGLRPVLVVSAEPLNQKYHVVMVAPLTSRKAGRVVRFGEVVISKDEGGLPQESLALCYQVRAIDKSRLRTKYGTLTDLGIQQEIQRTIADCFDLIVL